MSDFTTGGVGYSFLPQVGVASTETWAGGVCMILAAVGNEMPGFINRTTVAALSSRSLNGMVAAGLLATP